MTLRRPSADDLDGAILDDAARWRRAIDGDDVPLDVRLACGHGRWIKTSGGYYCTDCEQEYPESALLARRSAADDYRHVSREDLDELSDRLDPRSEMLARLERKLAAARHGAVMPQAPRLEPGTVQELRWLGAIGLVSGGLLLALAVWAWWPL